MSSSLSSSDTELDVDNPLTDPPDGTSAPPAAAATGVTTNTTTTTTSRPKKKGKRDVSGWGPDDTLTEDIVSDLHGRLLKRAADRVGHGHEVKLVDPLKSSSVTASELNQQCSLMKIVDTANVHNHVHTSMVGAANRAKNATPQPTIDDPHANIAKALHSKASDIILNTALELQNARPKMEPKRAPTPAPIDEPARPTHTSSNLPSIQQALQCDRSDSGSDTLNDLVPPPMEETLRLPKKVVPIEDESTPPSSVSDVTDVPEREDSSQRIEVLAANSAIRSQLERADLMACDYLELKAAFEAQGRALGARETELTDLQMKYLEVKTGGETLSKTVTTLETDLEAERKRTACMRERMAHRAQLFHISQNKLHMCAEDAHLYRQLFYNEEFALLREQETTAYLEGMVGDLRAQEEADRQRVAQVEAELQTEREERREEKLKLRTALCSAEEEIAVLTQRCLDATSAVAERDALRSELQRTEQSCEAQHQATLLQKASLDRMTQNLQHTEAQQKILQDESTAHLATIALRDTTITNLQEKLCKTMLSLEDAEERKKQELAAVRLQLSQIADELDESNLRVGAREAALSRVKGYWSRLLAETLQLRITLCRRNDAIEDLYSDISRSEQLHKHNNWLVHRFSYTLDDINSVKRALSYQSRLHKRILRNAYTTEQQTMSWFDHDAYPTTPRVSPAPSLTDEKQEAFEEEEHFEAEFELGIEEERGEEEGEEGEEEEDEDEEEVPQSSEGTDGADALLAANYADNNNGIRLHLLRRRVRTVNSAGHSAGGHNALGACHLHAKAKILKKNEAEEESEVLLNPDPNTSDIYSITSKKQYKKTPPVTPAIRKTQAESEQSKATRRVVDSVLKGRTIEENEVASNKETRFASPETEDEIRLARNPQHNISGEVVVDPTPYAFFLKKFSLWGGGRGPIKSSAKYQFGGCAGQDKFNLTDSPYKAAPLNPTFKKKRSALTETTKADRKGGTIRPLSATVSEDIGMLQPEEREMRHRYQPAPLPSSNEPLVSPAYRVWGAGVKGRRGVGALSPGGIEFAASTDAVHFSSDTMQVALAPVGELEERFATAGGISLRASNALHGVA